MSLLNPKWYLTTGTSGTPGGRFLRLLHLAVRPIDFWLMLRITAWAIALPLFRRVVPFAVLTQWMWKKPRQEGRKHFQEKKIAAFAHWIYSVLYSKTNCLERSLLLYRFLSREGFDPLLVTGLRRKQEGCVGHAWILVDERPFAEEQENLDEYVPFCIFSAHGQLDHRSKKSDSAPTD